MLKIGENAFRDHLFQHHREDLAALIVGKREPAEWKDDGFPQSASSYSEEQKGRSTS